MSDYRLIAEILLGWYDRNARSMPWRGIHDSYKTWISETMLQQTRVETVIPYYNRFLLRYPTLASLAAADESDVLKLWEGLGYYSRARNLLKGARQVMESCQGVLPRDPVLLEKISGIGPYTAGAIASIAYGIPVPAVDGNVHRVYSRLFGIRENIRRPETRKKLEAIAASIVPGERPGDYNQAVMDLGATVCVPGTPDCSRCPLSAACDAFTAGDAADLPLFPEKAPPKVHRWTVPVLCAGNCILVRQRTESLLNGLWCFPMLDCSPADAPSLLLKKYRIHAVAAGASLQARHVFTHLVWEMTVLPMETAQSLPAPADYRWVSADELNSLAFPSAMSIPLQAAEKLLTETK